jgi:ABC-type Fe3+ transport system permease subunit
MQEIYQPPTSTESSAAQDHDFLRGKRKLWAWLKWISFSLLLLIPMNGIIATVIGMQRAFRELAQTGQADPAELAANISVALLTAFWGFVLSLPIFIFWVFAIKRHKKWKELLKNCALKN